MLRVARQSRVVSFLAVLLMVANAANAVSAAGWSGVVNFSSRSCAPCQQMAPIVEKLQRENLPIRKVDTNESPDLAAKHGVNSIPAFVLFVDGKEQDRIVGAMSEADLRRFIDRIPLTRPAANDAVALGDAADFPVVQPASGVKERPRATPLVQGQLAPPQEQESLIGKLLPFGKKEAVEPVVRGNDVALGESAGFPAGQSPSGGAVASRPDPMASSVRLRVYVGDHVNLGSGTVISSSQGHTIILTCGHIFRGVQKDSKIEVDVFENGEKTIYVARLEKFDLESDLGVITIPTDKAVSASSVAGTTGALQVGLQVASIGCSGGENPTRDQVRVTSIDKYEGPNNIECTGVPVQGRSGGGLFSPQGELVGVCIASDPKEQRGLYSGLQAIHTILDQCSLTKLYKRTTEAAAIAEASAASASPFAGGVAPALMESTPVASTGEPQRLHAQAASSAVPASLAVDSGASEVVVIVRDKGRPDQPNKVIIIHEASPKFLRFLNGELESPAPVAALSASEPAEESLRTAAYSPLPGMNRSLRVSGDTSVLEAPLPVASRMQKTDLAPTSFSQPRARRYVRSAASR